MLQLAEFYGPVASDIEASARIFHNELASDQGCINDLCRHVGGFRGKQLRPALLLLTGRACGEITSAHHVLAAVVEMIHIATLLHDDVLDDADVRRQTATVNRIWGNQRAVLMGDFFISHAFHLCSSLDSQDASRLIGQTTNTICEGEMMQVANCYNYDLTEDLYLDVITRKTASLIGTCCTLGAESAGGEPGVVQRMKQFGLSLGIAFQITDDVLDLVGDEAEVGKSLGRDVDEGKLTLPLIHCLAQAPATQRDRLMTLLRGEDPGRHAQIAALLQECGGVEYAQQMAEDHVAKARAALAVLPQSDAQAALAAAADFVLTRRR